MATRCHYCHNVVLEFQRTVNEHGNVYHPKCLELAHVPASDHDEEMARRKAELQKQRDEARHKAEEEFASMPKYIGTIDVHVGGFVVDPRTGARIEPTSDRPHLPVPSGAAHPHPHEREHADGHVAGAAPSVTAPAPVAATSEPAH